MSLTMDRMCGFLSVACKQSNTSKLPSVNWKLKNSAIILNKWQANSYTTPMIKQMTSFSTFFVTKLDGSCIYGEYEWEGGSLWGCSNNEIIAPMPEISNRCWAPCDKTCLRSLLIWTHSLFNAQSKEICCLNPWGPFNVTFNKIKMPLDMWPTTVLHKTLSGQLGFGHQLEWPHPQRAFESWPLCCMGQIQQLSQTLEWETC